jgi:hypothetical protein
VREEQSDDVVTATLLSEMDRNDRFVERKPVSGAPAGVRVRTRFQQPLDLMGSSAQMARTKGVGSSESARKRASAAGTSNLASRCGGSAGRSALHPVIAAHKSAVTSRSCAGHPRHVRFPLTPSPRIGSTWRARRSVHALALNLRGRGRIFLTRSELRFDEPNRSPADGFANVRAGGVTRDRS